jgi:23S rRNA (cytosine1962-C5)-methyltransferase
LTIIPRTYSPYLEVIQAALEARAELFDSKHETAFRLFNGFYEGFPELTIDLYGRTLVLFNYAEPPEAAVPGINSVVQFFREQLPWLRSVVLKSRKASSIHERHGIVLHGETPDRVILEHGVRYAIDLLMSQDASFYLDTRNVRTWAIESLGGKTVLNTFAYTGSLGIAARSAGANRVVYVDLKRKYLNLAKASYKLNGFPIHKNDFIASDFFTQTRRYRISGERFDCVIVDPPFFAKTRGGTIDMLHNSHRLINKVRPLVNDGGYLLIVNNALYMSGEDYYEMLGSLCVGGYLSIETLIAVPQDLLGYPDTILGSPPVDPTPFNHPTKIALLSIRRKDA